MAALASGKEPETGDADRQNLITAAREFTAARTEAAYTTAATRSAPPGSEAAPTAAPAQCERPPPQPDAAPYRRWRETRRSAAPPVPTQLSCVLPAQAIPARLE